MLFGKKIQVLREIPKVWRYVGEGYPEYFWAYELNGYLEYCIIDDTFGRPSPANFVDSPYAIKLRTRAEEILRELEKEGYIKEIRD